MSVGQEQLMADLSRAGGLASAEDVGPGVRWNEGLEGEASIMGRAAWGIDLAGLFEGRQKGEGT